MCRLVLVTLGRGELDTLVAFDTTEQLLHTPNAHERERRKAEKEIGDSAMTYTLRAALKLLTMQTAFGSNTG